MKAGKLEAAFTLISIKFKALRRLTTKEILRFTGLIMQLTLFTSICSTLI